MGTRSTVKFYQNGVNVLSVYQQYDGYVANGVGEQVAKLLTDYEVVNGIMVGEERKVANGIQDLALFYVLDNKTGVGNMYATSERDTQDYDYEIRGGFNKIEKIVVREYELLIFSGTPEEYLEFVDEEKLKIYR